MKNLETLIQELCPDGVEFRTMEEVFEIRNGYTPSKNNPDFWEGGTIPWFRMEDIRQNGRILSDAIQHITPAAIKGKGLFRANSIIIATTATIGEHALVIADSLANQQFTNLSVRKSLSACLLPKFVFYYMFVIDEWCKKNVNAGNFASVDMKRFKKLEFPLPPIEVQTDIVRILDKFTSLEAELEAELDCRKRQYEYYRDKLLSFENMGGQDVEWKKMSEVCEIKGRIGFRGYTRNDLVSKGEGAISMSPSNIVNGVLTFDDNTYLSWEKYEESPEIMAKVGNIVFTKTGSTVGKTALIKKLPQECTINPQLVLITCTDCNNRYLTHVMQDTRFQAQVRKFAGIGSVPNISQKALAGILVPIPSEDEQERIANILDRFESLTTSLTAGLPAEIAARRQQYEHYRDQLLTFKRKSA